MKFILVIVIQIIGGPGPFVSTMDADNADECQHLGDVYKRTAEAAKTKVSWLCVEKVQK